MRIYTTGIGIRPVKSMICSDFMCKLDAYLGTFMDIRRSYEAAEPSSLPATPPHSPSTVLTRKGKEHMQSLAVCGADCMVAAQTARDVETPVSCEDLGDPVNLCRDFNERIRIF